MPEEAQDRRCLRCQQLFPSDGPGNRICTVCRIANRAVKPIERHRTRGTQRFYSSPTHDNRGYDR